MKKVLIFGAIFVFTLPCLAATRYVTTSTPLRTPYNRPYAMQNYAYNRLADVEMSVLGRNYNGQNINSRLNRLEKRVFNRTYPKSTIEQRIDNLVVNSRNNPANMTPVNSNGKVQNIINGISSAFFGGTPTGFTPPVNPYYSYGNNSYGTNYGRYTDYYGNRGWYRRNNSIGTGTGVHILD